MPRSVKEVADLIDARVVGDGTVMLTGISSIGAASKGDLVFVTDQRKLSDAIASGASAIITAEPVADLGSSKPLLLHSHPRLAFARAARLIRPPLTRKSCIHPTAVVHHSASLGSNISIEAQVVVEEGVRIGSGTWIGAGTVISKNVSIGENCELYPNVTIYSGVTLGARVAVHAGAVLGSDGFGYARDEITGHYEKFPQIGRLIIEDDVEIGANSTVDRGALELTRIRRGTKIDNLVHVGHNVQIGEDVVIAAQTGLSGSAMVEDGVVIGGQVGIADHAKIESGAILGAQSGIPSNKIIRGKGMVFWGTPARPIREYLKQLAVLARRAKRD
ncbi:MAG: UDP-3-O-(3-hydroxymyristoyl)glucosamine N-acyltransferase [Acidobacteriaceae bacterium]|nr:UDP-3-O-(3-hydroxymyristoyl)glucosamine N-acyltransferase [Acidobacteriaceae bacterium]